MMANSKQLTLGVVLMGQLTIDRTERGMNKPGVTLLVRHLVQLQSLLVQTRVVLLLRRRCA